MTKNRHELPRKRPGRPAKQEIAEDLPVLEPLAEELPTLEPVDDDVAGPKGPDSAFDDGPVMVRHQRGEAGFDLAFTVDVPAMEKAAVADAVRRPLQRALAAAAAELRHRRVLVRFAGEALIGSAVKDSVASLIQPYKPLLAVVRRGFGDEMVARGALPEVRLTLSESSGVTRATVDGAGLDAADLAMAMLPHLERLRSQVSGRKVVFTFTGGAKPDAALRTTIAEAMRAGGAVRAAIGERVLFDQELMQRVRVTRDEAATTIAVDPADDDADTLEALAMVLPEHAAACRDRVVRVDLARPVASARKACIEFASKHGAIRVEIGNDIVWPPLVAVAAAAETTLRLVPTGRSRAQVLAALRVEAGEHVAATKGKIVVLDWPAGFALDAEVEACVREVAAVLQPKALSCTVAGEHREPFVPDPVVVAVVGDELVIRIDSEAGKPLELQRALDRRLPRRLDGAPGRAVRVQVVGGVALSRTLWRSVVAALERAGAARLSIEEADVVDVVLPPLLTASRSAAGLRIAAMTAGRDAAQQAKALTREIDGIGIAEGDTVFVGGGPAADAVVAAAIAKGAARVLLDGDDPLQVHPPLFAPPEKKGLNVRFPVRGGADAAMAARQAARELPGLLGQAGSLAGATCTVAWPGGDAEGPAMRQIAAALVERRVARLLFDRGDGKPRLLYPAPAPAAAPVAAAPASAAPSGALVELLGRRDEAVPPMAIVGVAAGADDRHAAAVAAELEPHLPRFRGRAILVVLRANGRDVPVRKPDALTAMLGRMLAKTASATLVFRGPDAKGRPHFQVLHSTLRALPVGAVFADPRAK